SPKVAWPAVTTSSIAAGGTVFDTATSVTEPTGRPARAQASAIACWTRFSRAPGEVPASCAPGDAELPSRTPTRRLPSGNRARPRPPAPALARRPLPCDPLIPHADDCGVSAVLLASKF